MYCESLFESNLEPTNWYQIESWHFLNHAPLLNIQQYYWLDCTDTIIWDSSKLYGKLKAFHYNTKTTSIHMYMSFWHNIFNDLDKATIT